MKKNIKNLLILACLSLLFFAPACAGGGKGKTDIQPPQYESGVIDNGPYYFSEGEKPKIIDRKPRKPLLERTQGDGGKNDSLADALLERGYVLGAGSDVAIDFPDKSAGNPYYELDLTNKT